MIFWSRFFYQVMIKFAATADNCAFCHLRSAQIIQAFRSEVKSLANMIFCGEMKTDVGKFLCLLPLAK